MQITFTLLWLKNPKGELIYGFLYFLPVLRKYFFNYRECQSGKKYLSYPPFLFRFADVLYFAVSLNKGCFQ